MIDFRRGSAIVLWLFSQALVVQAWGPISHIGIALEAENGSKNPIPKEYLADFLAGCTEPDIGAGNGSSGLDKGVSDAYKIYHDPVFVEAMIRVAATKQGAERQALLARARGFQVHQKADSVSHTSTGYPNAKHFYGSIPIKTDYMPNHIANELCLDILEYDRSAKQLSGVKLNFIHAGTMVAIRNEYAKRKGIDLKSDQNELAKQILTHKATVTTLIKVAQSIRKNNPQRISEMKVFFSDRSSGVNGTGGRDDALKAVRNSTTVGPDKQTADGNGRGGMSEAIAGIVGGGTDLAMMSAEDIALLLASQDSVAGSIKSTANSQLQSTNTKLFANLVVNLLGDKDRSFREVIQVTEQAVQGPSARIAERQKELEVEAGILKEKVEKARREYDKRPWWKFWLYITNSDKKKYLALKGQYDRLQAEIAALSAPTGITPASSGIMAAAPSGGAKQNNSMMMPPAVNGTLVDPAMGTTPYAAYQEYAAAAARGDQAGAEAARKRYLEMKAAYERKQPQR